VFLADDIKRNKLRAKFVANVHDEWQIECHEEDADAVGKAGVRAIMEAGESLALKCPLDGEYQVGANWSETH
jgi:DNA polymerase I-like protein with 3'-5' exonuclease and polymerase domains